MAAKMTFDPLTKVIQGTVAPVDGRVTLDVQVDMYSAAKQDWLNDLSLNRFRFPFRDSFGGQNLGGNIRAGAYYFLDNVSGWMYRPYEADHELIINGNFFGTDPNTPIVQSTVGPYTVLLRLNSSQLTQAVTNESLAENVWSYER